MIRYSESGIRRSLRALPSSHRAAFAAACAERLLPAIGGTVTPTQYRLARRALNLVWGVALGKRTSRLEAHAESLLQLLPAEESAEIESALADDAIAVLVYAINTAVGGSVSDSEFASRRTYDSIDFFVGEALDVAPERRLAHPLVQAELDRQRADLNFASAHPRSELDALRKHARRAAPSFFGGQRASHSRAGLEERPRAKHRRRA